MSLPISPSLSRLVRLDAVQITPSLTHALRAGAVLARADAAILTLTGSGAVTCMQGLLTNDVEKPGDGAFVFGALLTPKGMIVSEGWSGRAGDTVRFTVPAEGREAALTIFRKSIPPRLAVVEDRTETTSVLRLAGARALAIAEAARLAHPTAPGHVV